MAMKKPITRCPHCGSDEGIYIKKSYINMPFYIGLDGTIQHNGEMLDNAEKIVEGSIAYCQHCDKPICRMSTLEKQWEEAENAT